MNVRYLFTTSIALMIAACASTTEVVPAGKDTYVIGGYNDISGGAHAKSNLYKKANAHCEEMGRKLLPLDESVSLNQAELRFRCLNKDDPEYVRPIMELVPDVRIESD